MATKGTDQESQAEWERAARKLARKWNRQARRAKSQARSEGRRLTASAGRIKAKCDALAEMLIAKNASYGDSALRPLGIFASGDPVLNLAARIDDKLARIKNDRGAFGEDPVRDLLGYLILLEIALEDQAQPTVPFSPAA